MKHLMAFLFSAGMVMAQFQALSVKTQAGVLKVQLGSGGIGAYGGSLPAIQRVLISGGGSTAGGIISTTDSTGATQINRLDVNGIQTDNGGTIRTYVAGLLKTEMSSTFTAYGGSPAVGRVQISGGSGSAAGIINTTDSSGATQINRLDGNGFLTDNGGYYSLKDSGTLRQKLSTASSITEATYYTSNGTDRSARIGSYSTSIPVGGFIELYDRPTGSGPYSGERLTFSAANGNVSTLQLTLYNTSISGYSYSLLPPSTISAVTALRLPPFTGTGGIWSTDNSGVTTLVAGGSGDMLLGTAQTVTATKTFQMAGDAIVINNTSPATKGIWSASSLLVGDITGSALSGRGIQLSAGGTLSIFNNSNAQVWAFSYSGSGAALTVTDSSGIAASGWSGTCSASSFTVVAGIITSC